MRMRRKVCATVVSLAMSAAQGQPSVTGMAAVPRADFCVTEGGLDEMHDGVLAVTVPKMRAYVNRPSSDAAEVRFTYLGSTAIESRLGSGVSRRQFGLKLRAANACNVIYAMWRIEPESKLVVSVKTNAGQQSSAECANHGYRTVKPTFAAATPRLAPGQTHRLLAQIRDQELRAFIDGNIVWEGTLGSAARDLRGPVGVRSDNARLEFTLSIEAPAGSMPKSVLPRCRAAAEESE